MPSIVEILAQYDHLKLHEANEAETRLIRRGLPREWCTHPLKALERDFENNLLRVMASAERHYGPNAVAS